MIYVLAYPRFDPSCAAEIADFRARHEPRRAKLVPPHVTLVFGVQDRHAVAVTDLADKAAEQTRAFSVSFESHVVEFDPFEKTHKIFLLCHHDRGELTSLHERLYAGPHRTELSAAQGFKPHMTVASYASRLDAERIDVDASLKLPMRGQIEALHIVRLADGQLSTLKTVPLGP